MSKTRNLLQFNGGFKVTKFNKAVKEEKKAYADVVIIDSFKDKEGNEHKTIAYFKAFGKIAERLNKMKTGSVIIEGHLASSEYEDKTSTFNVIDHIIATFETKTEK